MRRKAEVSFKDWLELECKYGDLLLPVITMCILQFSVGMLALMHVALIGFFLGLLLSFALGLRIRWKRDLEDPPWYLFQEEREEREKWK